MALENNSQREQYERCLDEVSHQPKQNPRFIFTNNTQMTPKMRESRLPCLPTAIASESSLVGPSRFGCLLFTSAVAFRGGTALTTAQKHNETDDYFYGRSN